MKDKIAVVIPCYKVQNHIEDVIKGLSSSIYLIDLIVLVDDRSPDNTLLVMKNLVDLNKKIVIVEHQINQGVGGAMISGFNKALEMGSDIIVKMDGDNQMDPAYLPSLIKPIEIGQCHFSKGNRFFDLRKLSHMPFVRRMGNLGLSFLIKASSGYWSVFDPTNGYFAISAKTLKLMNFENLDRRYFFESSFLIELYYTGAVIKDIPIPARYADEVSNLSISNTLLKFPPKLFKAFIKRIILKYFIYDFSVFTIYLLFGLPLLIFGFLFGLIKWIHYDSLNVTAPTGTVMIAVLSIVIGFQLLLSVIQYDITSKMPYAGQD